MWMEEPVRKTELVVDQVDTDTKEHVADFTTKGLPARVAAFSMGKLGVSRAGGRSNLTLGISCVYRPSWLGSGM